MTTRGRELTSDAGAAGALTLSVVVAVPSAAGGSSDAASASADATDITPAAALASRLQQVGSTGLAALLGVDVTVGEIALETVTVQRVVVCPRGYWCSAANRIACTPGTYNNQTDQIDAGACTSCPHLSESPPASESISACVCTDAHYDADAGTDAVLCLACPIGSACEGPGTSLAALPLLAGYYRTGGASDDIRRCPDLGSNSSGCVGGISDGGGAGPCKPWLEGPYCRLCNVSDRSRYYHPEKSSCLPCDQGSEGPLWTSLLVLVGLVVLVLLWLRFPPLTMLGRVQRFARVLQLLSSQMSVRPKFKQMLGFYQIATRISSVYDVAMPDAVRRLLSVFELFNINIGGFGLPLQCVGLGTYEQQLTFTMVAPAVLAVGLILGFVLRSCICGARAETRTEENGRRGRRPSVGAAGGAAAAAAHHRRHDPSVGGGARQGMLDALPSVLTLSFLVFPMVSSAAFQAFSCEGFDDGRSYLRADYAVECETPAHARAQQLAWLGIALYPIGISVLYVLLLVRARVAIASNNPTALSEALDFLVRDYEPAYLWWELIEAWKKLFLVGFAVVLLPGTFYQLVIGFLFSLVFMLLMCIAQPFKDDGDDYFAKACCFALTSLFFFSLVLKVGTLTEAVDDVLSQQLRRRFVFDSAVVSVGMVACNVGALALAVLMAVHQIVQAAQMPTVLLVATRHSPVLSLGKGGKWHLFLSHIWGTGQDQCATIKRQLCLLLKGVSVFLDVDDLEDIGALETYVDQSAVIMIFVSKGYFKSGNCLREARCTVDKKKPIALVHDPVRGGATLDFIRDEECPDELRGPVFGHGRRPVIEWHRIADFQQVSIKLLAEQIVLAQPAATSKLLKEGGLYVVGELPRRRLAFRGSVLVYASPNNPGALRAAEQLCVGMGRAARATGSEGATPQPRRATQMLPQPGQATHMLLYLNEHTFVGDAGARLADELRAVRAMEREAMVETRVVMVHENDAQRGGCEFGRLFETTPGDLIQDGLYKALALALYPGAFWPVSVALVAKALGAVESRQRGHFSTASAALQPVHPDGDLETPPSGGGGEMSLLRASAAWDGGGGGGGGSGGGGVAGSSGGGGRLPAAAPSAMAEEMAGIVFGRYDRDNSGELESAELASACAELGHPLSERELATAMQALDQDGSGRVGRTEFMRFWQHGMKVEALLDEAYASTVLSASSAARAHVVASSSADAATDAAHDERAELRSTFELDDGGGGSKDRPGRKTEAGERRGLSKKLSRLRSSTDALKDAATGKGTKPDSRFLKRMRELSSKPLPMPQRNQVHV